MIIALRAPADGPIGDSGIVVSDGTTTVFNMNDSRPLGLDMLAEFGHRRTHAAVLRRDLVPDGLRHARARQGGVRRPEAPAGMDRCRQYISDVDATWVIPSAGPPCFLDPVAFPQ